VRNKAINRQIGLLRLVRAAAAVACCLFLVPLQAGAQSDPLIGVLTGRGDPGLGIATHAEQSMYRGGGTRFDLVPLYLYEGKYVYLHSYRAGLKLDLADENRVDMFLAHRFESFPYDRIPSSLAGMAERAPGLDAGVSYSRRAKWGRVYAELLHDVSGSSYGNEFRLGYSVPWQSAGGGLELKPSVQFAFRDAKLNNYYYGVQSREATVSRPAYDPGSGINARIGLDAHYRLSPGWRLLAGISATHWAGGVRRSPIVDNRVQVSGFVGAAYDFERGQKVWQEHLPLVVKLMYGKATDCNLVNVMRLGCTSTSTPDRTRLSAIEIGRPFIQGLNGWPLDFVGYIGALQHDDRGRQPNAWQFDAYMKAFYYGLPWDRRVHTRIGFGAGISYAQRVPFVEAADQLRRGRNTSKLLNYLDPSIDVSVGDIVGVKSMHDTYLGFGVSHRSGIFATSQMLGNVDGGSNYIYTYVEWQM
jgi:outer membrane protein